MGVRTARKGPEGTLWCDSNVSHFVRGLSCTGECICQNLSNSTDTLKLVFSYNVSFTSKGKKKKKEL